MLNCYLPLPEAIFSLRVDPVQMNKWNPEEVDFEVRKLIDSTGSKDKIAVCCINMDDKVPDENITTIFETVEELRKQLI